MWIHSPSPILVCKKPLLSEMLALIEQCFAFLFLITLETDLFYCLSLFKLEHALVIHFYMLFVHQHSSLKQENLLDIG